MMKIESFTNQKRRVATEEECRQDWNCAKNGAKFRCFLCGHKFKPGDGWRWVYAGHASYEGDDGEKYGVKNIMICDSCDGPDVLSRWVERVQEFNNAMRNRYWALR